MKIALQILLGLLLVALAVGLKMEHQTKLKLVAQQEALTQQLVRLAALATENQQLSNRLAQVGTPDRLPPAEFTELLRLRGEAALLRPQKKDLLATHKENDQIHASLSNYLSTAAGYNRQSITNYWPQNSWTNAGYDTPEAALQTQLWALNNGDLSNFIAGLTPDAFKDIAGNLTNKSASEVSADMANDFYDLKSVRLLKEEFADPNTALLELEIMRMNNPNTITMVMKRVGDQWLFGGPR